MKYLFLIPFLFITSCGKHITNTGGSLNDVAIGPSLSMKDQAFEYVSQGNSTELKKLIEKGLDINIKNQEGKSLLMVAVVWEKIQIIKLLMGNNADVTLTDNDGNDVFEYASQNEIIISLLNGEEIPKEKLDTGLLTNVKDRNHDKVKVYLELGANINTQDRRKSTPLIIACNNGDFEMVQILVDHPEIDINMQGPRSTTALFWAKRKGFVEIVNLLEERGAI